MEKLRALRLHEWFEISSSTRVQRVPGGWVYLYRSRNILSTVFVPYVINM